VWQGKVTTIERDGQGVVVSGWVRLGSVRYGLVQPSKRWVWLGVVGYCRIWLGGAWYDKGYKTVHQLHYWRTTAEEAGKERRALLWCC